MKKFFLVVLISLLPLVLFFTWQFLRDMSNYQRLEVKIPITVLEWKINEEQSNTFKVVVSYRYLFREKLFQDQKAFKRSFMSSDAALIYLKQQSDKNLFAWVDPFKPRESSLEKVFPIRQCINAILAIAIFIYFLLFKYYLHKKFPE